MSTPDYNNAALKKAKEHAHQIAGLAKARWSINPLLRNWPALQKSLGITIPGMFTQAPCDFSTVNQFAQYWINSVEARIATSLDANPATPVIARSDDNITFGKITLYPEQAGTFLAIRDAMFHIKSHRVALNDGQTGSGKTFLAGALIADCVKHNRHIPPVPKGMEHMAEMLGSLPYRYLIVTRKTVIKQYLRVLEAFGLGPLLGTLIVVTSYSQLSASFGKVFMKEVFDPYTDKSSFVFQAGLAPFFVVWDECHGLNNQTTQQTQFALAMNRLKQPPFQLFMSATPFVTVNHTRTFVVASRHQFLGMTITEDNFGTFAGNICARPDKPNKAAAKRLREVLKSHIFSFPKIKWPHKAINQVLIVDFESDEDRATYDKAFTVFMEKKAKAGENTKFGRFEEFVAIGQFRKAAEPLHVPALVRETVAHLQRGDKQVIIGVAFRETVQRFVYEMIHKHGYTREDFAIIWGGKRAWRDDLLLSDEDMNTLFERMRKGEELEDDEVKALKESIEYRTERIMSNESAEAQAKRHAMMATLNLAGTQSADQRQKEVDAFQTGQAKVCIFTLAAGGVGLSLDHDRPETLPRVGYFTPVYSGPEVQQALGRAVRRATLSDTRQYIVYLRDTIEESHVAPAMDKKVKCIAEITGNFFNTLDLDNIVTHHGSTSRLRTEAEILADAELETAQLNGAVEGDDGEEDDD